MRAPTWLRAAMLGTALMNFGAAILFLPPAGTMRALAGFPDAAPAVYLAILAMFVALFGAGYLWVAVTGRADPLFVGLAAAGKTAFVTLLVGFAACGGVPWRAPLVAGGDLVFALLFVRWLVAAAPGTRR